MSLCHTGDPYGPWWAHNMVVFDVESTGLDESSDRVVEIGFARFEKGELVDTYGTLINPRMIIPEAATQIHGISNEDVKDAPAFGRALGEMLNISRNAYPVAYNASFDRRFFAMEIGRLLLPALQTPMFDPAVEWLDPLVWARKKNGIWGKNKLTDICERNGISLVNAHRATDDAVAAGKVLFHVVRNTLPSVTITEAIRRQKHYDKIQDDERRAWFEKKGLPYR